MWGKTTWDRFSSVVGFAGMVVEPTQGRLYYTNMGFVEVESTTFSWHKIESVSLTEPNTDRRTIVETAERPRGLSINSGSVPKGEGC